MGWECVCVCVCAWVGVVDQRKRVRRSGWEMKPGGTMSDLIQQTKRNYTPGTGVPALAH